MHLHYCSRMSLWTSPHCGTVAEVKYIPPPPPPPPSPLIESATSSQAKAGDHRQRHWQSPYKTDELDLLKPPPHRLHFLFILFYIEESRCKHFSPVPDSVPQKQGW